MKKVLILPLLFLLISSTVFAFDVTIDSDGNVTTGASGASGNLEVTGASGEDGIIGSASGTGAVGVYGEHKTGTTVNSFGILGDELYGVYGYSFTDWAGYFEGAVNVTGDLTIGGNTNFTQPLLITSPVGATTIHGVNSASGSGTGVRGEGDYMGVAGYTQYDTGVGVYGQTGTTGANYGVYGYSRSPLGYGVFGKNDAGGYAGYFEGDVEILGTITGNGSGLTNLNASQVTSGTVADARLSANVDLLDADQSFTGVKNFAPSVGTVPFTVDVSKTGPVANLNADLLDGQEANEIIAAASDEVRTPISSCNKQINVAGTYYVTQNLSAIGNTNCITINASHVTLDLMGFSLSGNRVASGHGVQIIGNDVEVKNGTITNFDYGIYGNVNGFSYSVYRIRVISNLGNGMSLSNASIVKDCTASFNGLNGIAAYEGSLITDNVAHGNILSGIAGTGYTATNNTAYANGRNGISCQNDCFISENTAFGNNTTAGYPNIGVCATCTFGTNHAP